MSANSRCAQQLVHVDEAGRCHIQEEAAAYLGQFEGKLSVIGIAGLYRTGKSFLLNRLLGSQSGFAVGSSVNPCTKGLWIWGEAVQLAPDHHCILIDTEGLGSTQRTASCDMQVFSLCVLLSSYFIYNAMGAIDEQAIDELHLVLKLAEHVHSRSEASCFTGEGSKLASNFPSLLWVLRDFHLQLHDRRGKAMTERDYLEEALAPRPGQRERNAVRTTIKDLFVERDCATLVRPMAHEADLRRLDRHPYTSLRPEFRSQVDSLVTKVYAEVKPKQLGSMAVSGPALVGMLTEYCKTINSGALPAINSVWTSAVLRQSRLCVQHAQHVFEEHVSRQVNAHLPMSPSQLQDRLNAAEQEALQILSEFDIESTYEWQCRADLGNSMTHLRAKVEAANIEASRCCCLEVAEELYDELISGGLDSYSSLEQLMRDWDQLRELYMERTSGPAQAEVMSTWLLHRMTLSVRRVHVELQRGVGLIPTSCC